MVAAVWGAHAPSRAGDDALVIANFFRASVVWERYVSCPRASPLRRGYLFSAKGAPSLAAWGNAPGHPDISNLSALKARFIAVVDNMKSDEEHPVSCRSTGSGPEQKPKGIALSALDYGWAQSLGRCPRLK